MKRKYFFTKEFCTCPLNSLSPNEIKKSYTNELSKDEIGRQRFYNLAAKTLGFQDWSIYEKAYENDITPFLQKNGLVKYAPNYKKNILRAEHDLRFSYRQVSDRLFLSGRKLPKYIFTGYDCRTDNIAYYSNLLLPELHELKNTSHIMIPNITDSAFTIELMNEILESKAYKVLKEDQELDLLIPMSIASLFGCRNLLGDTFFINEDSNDTHVFQAYVDYQGLIEQSKFIEIAKILKEELLKIEKGWIEIIPFNDNLIFLKAIDGTYDFVFKNLREDKFFSPYGKYIKHDNIPSLLNEEYDFERWFHFGFKEKKDNIKDIAPIDFWKERDEHLSEINFYHSNDFKNYPGSSLILKDYYIKEGLYSYNQKISNKKLDGFKRVELENKILNISQLVTIKDFFAFYKGTYSETRSMELDEIDSINHENEDFPVSVTWYDAIAYCRYLEKKYSVPIRLITNEEFQAVCPHHVIQNEQFMVDPYDELDFFYEDIKLQKPRPLVPHFEKLIIKHKNPLEYVENHNLQFSMNSTFREWSNHFREGYTEALSARYLNILLDNRYLANSNNKYKHIKIGFRVCYESPKEIK